MKGLALLPAAAALYPACAGAATGGGPDIAGSLVQMIASLALVIGIILILYWGASKFLNIPKGGCARYIRVVETRHLAPKRSLVLVEVGGEYLLLSNSGEGISFIKQVEMLEEIEVVAEPGCANLVPDQLRQKLKALKDGLPQGVAARMADLKRSGGIA